MKKVLGLVGLLALSSNANAQDTGYSEMSRPAITQQLKKRAVVLDQNNFQREVLDYDGAVMVLFDSTCPATQTDDNLTKNMDLVYLGLMDRSDSARVNGLDLKFAYFDGCGTYAQLPRGFFSQIGVKGLETHMYLDGRKIDSRIGGPLDISKIDGNIKAMSAWIETQLMDQPRFSDEGRKYVWAYNDTKEIHKVFIE